MRMDIQEVTEMAIEYAKKAGYPFVKIIKIFPDETYSKWKITIDVGPYTQIIKNIEIHDINGKIIRFE